MSKLPPKLKTKYINRFDELIAEGEQLHRNMETKIGAPSSQDFYGKVTSRRPDQQHAKFQPFVQWRTSVKTLLSQVVPQNHPHRKTVEAFDTLNTRKNQLEYAIAFLTSIRIDFEQEYFGNLALSVEAEIAVDYMGQAENLLKEGQSGTFDHVPAVVLAGAVLEKGLRTLCEEQVPAISLTTDKGKRKTLSPLIDDLKKAGIYNMAKARQLQAWADLRNHAAHGEFDQFTRQDADQMITGINRFLADYLG